MVWVGDGSGLAVSIDAMCLSWHVCLLVSVVPSFDLALSTPHWPRARRACTPLRRVMLVCLFASFSARSLASQAVDGVGRDRRLDSWAPLIRCYMRRKRGRFTISKEEGASTDVIILLFENKLSKLQLKTLRLCLDRLSARSRTWTSTPPPTPRRCWPWVPR